MRRAVCIVGATATGKTALAIAMAQALGGEIVNADSRQVYRGMDIGTAKPSAAEQASTPHWLLDVVDPDDPFTLAHFLELARSAITDIHARGRTVVLAGGTAQYIWALLEGWRVPRVPPDATLRAELEALARSQGAEAVFALLRQEDAAAAERIDPRNVRRVIRAIEVSRASGTPFSEWQDRREPALDACILGLRMDRPKLYARIDSRVDGMIAGGLLDEVRGLRERYGCDITAMSGIGYAQMCEHLSGECSLEDARDRIKTETHRLARMQHTWFRQDDARIRWLDAEQPDLAAAAIAALPRD